ncbi:IS481 family transposase [Tabrizicola sp.]|uniref:IS481 family transposase n=1 Tax=Tabrizicola sp. TaxID=2005166 RepID=UPI003F3A1AD8
MLTRLHANATTTPKTRAYIQSSTRSVAELAAELGVHETTIRRWRGRQTTADRSHRPHRLQTRFDAAEEVIAVELRRRLALSLDDITEVMRRCLRPDISRAAVHRCLKRHGVSQRPARPTQAASVFETDRPLGFIHVDVKYLTALDRRRAYAYVAIDRATRFVYLEILPDRSAATSAGFLTRFLAAFPIPVHTILSDNGSEFTDRYAVDKPGKPEGKPSGAHAFDRVCAARGIRHILARPFRPQTNGMVERFNRRLAESLAAHPKTDRNRGKNSFETHAARNAFIIKFVAGYNNTRLRCLDYKAPNELIANLTRHNTDRIQKVRGRIADCFSSDPRKACGDLPSLRSRKGCS